MPFADTDNKAVIRRMWDRPILERWRSHSRLETLTYFGLPGPDVCDLLDWRDILSKYRTGVEGYGKEPDERERTQVDVHRLLTNLFVAQISSGFELLRGDIEDVILDGWDHEKNRPQIHDNLAVHASHFAYDLVNLDFDGGLGYRDDTGHARRVSAIKHLFYRQEGHSFVLFLTINVRDTMGPEIEDYLRGLKSLDQSESWRRKMDWYLDRGEGERAYKLKVTVPSLIRHAAEHRVFRCAAYPPIAYKGHKADMIHFAFELTAVSSDKPRANLRGFSPQSEFDLVDLPLLVCEAGQLRRAPQIHPDFDWSGCLDCLEILPEEVKARLLTAVDGSIHV